MDRPKIKKGKVYEPAVLWTCRTCGAYNLHPVEWDEFDCISCGVIYIINFGEENGKNKARN